MKLGKVVYYNVNKDFLEPIESFLRELGTNRLISKITISDDLIVISPMVLLSECLRKPFLLDLRNFFQNFKAIRPCRGD